MPNPSLHSHRRLGYSRRSHRHLGVATWRLGFGKAGLHSRPSALSPEYADG